MNDARLPRRTLLVAALLLSGSVIPEPICPPPSLQLVISCTPTPGQRSAPRQLSVLPPPPQAVRFLNPLGFAGVPCPQSQCDLGSLSNSPCKLIVLIREVYRLQPWASARFSIFMTAGLCPKVVLSPSPLRPSNPSLWSAAATHRLYKKYPPPPSRARACGFRPHHGSDGISKT